MSNQLKRSAGLLVFEVVNGNPNGDPDSGVPRTFSYGQKGFVTPVSLKRKLRDILEDHTAPVFQEIAKRFDLKPERFEILESHHRGFDETRTSKNGAVEAAKAAFKLADTSIEKFLEKYWDVRVFGSTFLEEKEKGKGKGKSKDRDEKESATKTKFKRTGVVTFGVAESVMPVLVESQTLTKKAPAREDLAKNMQGDIAPGALMFVRHGIYCARIGVCPNLAKESQTSVEDIELLKFLLPRVFQNSGSASRPNGSINVLRCYWADHDNLLGSFDENAFYSKLTPVFKGAPGDQSSSISQYEFTDSLPGVNVVDLASGKVQSKS